MFWQELKKPIFVLAPMANVTDAAFRRIINKYGKPDVFWTEFVSVEGLLSRGREKLLPDLWFTPEEKPIVAQIFGGKPEQFYEVAKLIVELGFDGVDINMGCPDKGVEKSGGGANLIKDPKRAQRIIRELKRGVEDAAAAGGRAPIPVSVKTRIGYNKNEMETWLPALLETDIAALTVHLRTRKEMSEVPARWELAERVTQIVKREASQTLILGNGDVKDIAEARVKVKESGMDGVMLGRAIFGNPRLFSEKMPTTEEKLRVAVEHTKLFEELYSVHEHTNSQTIRTKQKRIKPFDVMKKHFKAYVNGFDGAKELRVKMMDAETPNEIESLVDDFLRAAQKT